MFVLGGMHDGRLIETWDVLKSEFAFPPLGGVFD